MSTGFAKTAIGLELILKAWSMIIQASVSISNLPGRTWPSLLPGPSALAGSSLSGGEPVFLLRDRPVASACAGI
jgi:hypothetical protein